MVYSKSREFSTNQVKIKNEGKELLNQLDIKCSISDSVQKIQLELIYSEISSMVSSVENPKAIKKIIASYPRLIADTWDFADELGISLLQFNNSYNKFMKKLTIIN